MGYWPTSTMPRVCTSLKLSDVILPLVGRRFVDVAVIPVDVDPTGEKKVADVGSSNQG